MDTSLKVTARPLTLGELNTMKYNMIREIHVLGKVVIDQLLSELAPVEKLSLHQVAAATAFADSSGNGCINCSSDFVDSPACAAPTVKGTSVGTVPRHHEALEQRLAALEVPPSTLHKVQPYLPPLLTCNNLEELLAARLTRDPLLPQRLEQEVQRRLWAQTPTPDTTPPLSAAASLPHSPRSSCPTSSITSSWPLQSRASFSCSPLHSSTTPSLSRSPISYPHCSSAAASTAAASTDTLSFSDGCFTANAIPRVRSPSVNPSLGGAKNCKAEAVSTCAADHTASVQPHGPETPGHAATPVAAVTPPAAACCSALLVSKPAPYPPTGTYQRQPLQHELDLELELSQPMPPVPQSFRRGADIDFQQGTDSDRKVGFSRLLLSGSSCLDTSSPAGGGVDVSCDCDGATVTPTTAAAAATVALAMVTARSASSPPLDSSPCFVPCFLPDRHQRTKSGSHHPQLSQQQNQQQGLQSQWRRREQPPVDDGSLRCTKDPQVETASEEETETETETPRFSPSYNGACVCLSDNNYYMSCTNVLAPRSSSSVAFLSPVSCEARKDCDASTTAAAATDRRVSCTTSRVATDTHLPHSPYPSYPGVLPSCQRAFRGPKSSGGVSSIYDMCDE